MEDASGIELVGDLGAPDPPDAGPSAEAASIANGDMPSAAPVRAAFTSGPGLDSMSTGLGTLVLVGFASVAATLARRERGRRRVRARIVARLEAMGRSAPATPAEAAPADRSPSWAPDQISDQGPVRTPDAPIGTQSGAELGANVRGSA